MGRYFVYATESLPREVRKGQSPLFGGEKRFPLEMVGLKFSQVSGVFSRYWFALCRSGKIPGTISSASYGVRILVHCCHGFCRASPEATMVHPAVRIPSGASFGETILWNQRMVGTPGKPITISRSVYSIGPISKDPSPCPRKGWSWWICGE